MREIKFRAWDKIQKIMHDWEYLSGWTFRQIESQKDVVVVMQYTGLKDKNGKEIYEGDIVMKPYIDPMGGLHSETDNGHFEVGFENGQFVIYRTEPDPLINWCEKEKGEYVSNYGNKTIVKDKTVFEIIGNLYENSDLLK